MDLNYALLKRCKVWKLKQAETRAISSERVQARADLMRKESRDVENRDIPDIWPGFGYPVQPDIRYIMISGIIWYPVEYQLRNLRYYPVPLSLDSYILS